MRKILTDQQQTTFRLLNQRLIWSPTAALTMPLAQGFDFQKSEKLKKMNVNKKVLYSLKESRGTKIEKHCVR